MEQPAKELYRELRLLSCAQLREIEMPRFLAAEGRERLDLVGIVRAVGVVFSEQGTAQEQEAIRTWLRPLLSDSWEKVRRYARNALTKLGAGEAEEQLLLQSWPLASSPRENQDIADTLAKIGGRATLDKLEREELSREYSLLYQKLSARLVRTQENDGIAWDRSVAPPAGCSIRLYCRRGLEEMVRQELAEREELCWKFRLVRQQSGWVEIIPLRSFSLRNLQAFRTCQYFSFLLGRVEMAAGDVAAEALAQALVSPKVRTLWNAFAEGGKRYRLEMAGRGKARSLVLAVADLAHRAWPELINDSRGAPWSVDVIPRLRGLTLELRPLASPDPRFTYRQDDVPASSHPPLAAALARLAGPWDGEVAWDPFCGSGQELIERTLLGGVSKAMGCDRSSLAIEVARKNFAAAFPQENHLCEFATGDFRDLPARLSWPPASLSLILTNPPMGRRAPVGNLFRLVQDLLELSARYLVPGGRLILVNPLEEAPIVPGLRLSYRRKIDLGGFWGYLEKWVRTGS